MSWDLDPHQTPDRTGGCLALAASLNVCVGIKPQALRSPSITGQSPPLLWRAQECEIPKVDSPLMEERMNFGVWGRR